jgi:hypothetical protein
MESKLSVMTEPAVQEAWRIYRSLVPRFEADLAASHRDVALAKAGALMVVQGFIGAEDGP